MCEIQKDNTKELIYKTEQTHRLRKQTYGCRGRGRMGGRDG